MNKHLKIGIGIVVLMLAIGFASVTTSLILNNNVKLGFNESNFDIYFSSAIPEDDGTATIDSTTKKTITYSTKTLKNVGDQAILDYVVTNASTQYDANCTVEFIIDDGYDEYLTISKTGFVENEPTVVNAQSSKSGRILIILKKGSMEPLQIHFTLKLIFTPVGKEEEAEGGQVPSSEDPTPSTCVPSGYYGIKCSCDDSTYIAWLDGPYNDINGNPMNPNRVRDINYPPTGTYICGCKNGQSGYVYNTGNLLESECPEEEPVEPVILADHQNFILKLDNRPSSYDYNDYWNRSNYGISIPAYDDETGTIGRLSYIMDIYNQVPNTTVEIVEVDGDDDPISNPGRIDFLGVTGNKYSYRVYVNNVGDSKYFEVILKNKSDSSIYSTNGNDYIYVYLVDWGSDYEDEQGKKYTYDYGKVPWATWFMNDGRNRVCWDLEECTA